MPTDRVTPPTERQHHVCSPVTTKPQHPPRRPSIHSPTHDMPAITRPGILTSNQPKIHPNLYHCHRGIKYIAKHAVSYQLALSTLLLAELALSPHACVPTPSFTDICVHGLCFHLFTIGNPPIASLETYSLGLFDLRVYSRWKHLRLPSMKPLATRFGASVGYAGNRFEYAAHVPAHEFRCPWVPELAPPSCTLLRS